MMFDESFASSLVNSALVWNIFEVPFVKRKHSTLSFVAGQPLGYHSSWPLFALSHHIWIWWYAKHVHPGKRFSRYAGLGDGVVITDRDVEAIYESALKKWGLSISYQKSIISENGSAEFSKRFRGRGLSVDLSPISIRNLNLLNFNYSLRISRLYRSPYERSFK